MTQASNVQQRDMKNSLAYRCLEQDAYTDGILSLSCVQPEHIESIRQWRNAQMAVLRQRAEISELEQIEYFETRIWPTLPMPNPDNILLSIHREEQHVGYGGLVHIAWPDRRAEVSFLLRTDLTHSDNEYANIFKRYLTLLSKLAFESLRFNRLFTETWAPRTHHIKALESAGFVREGLMRQHTIQQGVATDSVIHGKLAPNHLP